MLCSPSPPGERRCICKAGWVAWKWDCLPRAGLGEECSSSLQCQLEQGEGMECSPVSHTCACAHGFGPAPPSSSHTDPLCIKLHPAKTGDQLTYHEDTKVNEKASPDFSDDVIPVFVPLKQLATPKRIPSFGDSGHLIQRALEASLARHTPVSGHQIQDNDPKNGLPTSQNTGSSYTLIRSAVKASLNLSEGMVGDGGFEEEEVQIYWRTSYTMVLLGCLLLCLALAALLTGLYLRALQEKRASQATLKSLIKFLTDQEKEAGFGHTGEGEEGPLPPSYEDTEKKEPTPTFDYSILDEPRKTFPSRLMLAPLEGSNVIKLPAPHASHVPLPGIQAKKPNRRERRSYQQLDPTTLMGNPAAATLTQMLASKNSRMEEEDNSKQELN